MPKLTQQEILEAISEERERLGRPLKPKEQRKAIKRKEQENE